VAPAHIGSVEIPASAPDPNTISLDTNPSAMGGEEVAYPIGDELNSFGEPSHSSSGPANCRNVNVPSGAPAAEVARFAPTECSSESAPASSAELSERDVPAATSSTVTPPNSRTASSNGVAINARISSCRNKADSFPTTICHDCSGVVSSVPSVPARFSSQIAGDAKMIAARINATCWNHNNEIVSAGATCCRLCSRAAPLT
jgi:hypothetical protein